MVMLVTVCWFETVKLMVPPCNGLPGSELPFHTPAYPELPVGDVGDPPPQAQADMTMATTPIARQNRLIRAS
jgi:hypothetical protein